MGISQPRGGVEHQHDGSRMPSSLAEILCVEASRQPEHIIHTYLSDGENPGPNRTFASLDQNARTIAAALQDLATPTAAGGERVLLFYPPGLEFLDAFFGCMYGGVVATPAFPPDPAHLDQTLTRLKTLAFDAQASLVLTTQPIKHLLQPAVQADPLLGQLKWLATDALPSAASAWKERLPQAEDLAYIQYTSGSTRNPRGVCLTHANLVQNSAHICQAFELTPKDTGVIWLPMYHNLGLIGGLLQPFFAGMTCYLMSPLAFLQNPLVWLKAITRYKGTIAGAPNFAFDLCVQRIPAEMRAGLDLSTWDLAFNGGEAVRPETLDRFTAAFEPYGFRRQAFYPAYGLAESTLMVTGGKRGSGLVIARADAALLEQNQAKILPTGDPNGQTLVSCGQAIVDHQLVIVDPATLKPLAEDQVGEIWLRGPSVAHGYWRRPEDTQDTFQGYLSNNEGPFMRTGDLGFLHQQECFITGRLKELIIIRGRNLYPQDIERTALESHPALIPNGSAAFSVEIESEERLVIVQEINPKLASSADYDEIVRRMRQGISQAYGIQLHAVILVEPGSIGRTISGKIQRQLTRTQYLNQALRTLHLSVMEKQARPVENAAPAAAAPAAATDNLLLAAFQALGPEKSGSLLEAFLRTKIAQILKVPPSAIQLDEPLSSLGLDSITSIELAGMIKDALGVEVPLAEVAQGASLAELVKLVVAALSHAPAADEAQPLPAAPTPAPTAEIALPADATQPEKTVELSYPLTYGQRALWFTQQLHPEDIAHNIAYGVKIHEAVDTAAFKRALEKIVQRHPVLRTRFYEVDGQPVQHVFGGVDHFAYTVEDGTAWSEAQLQDRLDQEVNYVYNLETGPLMRMLLVKRAEQEYVAFLTMHHIVTDLWSMAMIGHELFEFYSAEKEHRLANLKPVRTSFAEMVTHEAEMLAGPEGEQHLAYWKERLSGELTALNLPTDHPRPAESSGRAAARTIHLDPELVQQLKTLAQENGTTLFATFLAAYYVLLYRYTGQTDLLVGTPKAGRGRLNATTAGYFINPVLMRAQLDGQMPFKQLLAQVAQNIQADFQHDAYPFSLLVEKVQPSRSLSSSPLLQVFFGWQKTHRMMDSHLITAMTLNEPSEPFQEAGVLMEAIATRARVTPTDMALLAAEGENDLGLTVEYSTDLFDASSIDRLFGHLTTLLTAAAVDASQPIGRMAMLTEAERRLVLKDWNRSALSWMTAEATTDWQPIHRLIERKAAQTPEKIALAAGERRLTYHEIMQQSRALARQLCEMGVGRGQVIGMFAERSPEQVIGLLAILQAGSTYLPLDPDFPEERLAYMLADSGASAVLTQSWLADRIPHTDAPRLCLDEVLTASTVAAANGEIAPVQPNDAAYMMYTSGSTGQPKGVLIPHRAIAHHARAMKEYFAYTADDRVLQFASLNFDPSLEQVFVTMLAGATLVLRDNDLWDPADFSKKIAELSLSVVNVPPAYWNHWTHALAKAEAAGTAPIDNPQLKTVIIGGDVMLPETLALWHATEYQSVRLINAYGPTEATITAAAYDVPFAPVQAGSRLPIGRPLGGRTAYILDANRQPTPVGVPGELYLGGICLALGYHNQPEMTAEKFIPDPFTDRVGARLYATGDLCRYLNDGTIQFFGRVDRQVKIMGIRIELGEIEASLKQHPSVADAVVLYSAQGSGRLTGCLLAAKGHTPNPAELTVFLTHRLPPYMVPTDFVVVTSFPHTPSGKLDREGLASLVEERRAAGETSSAQSYLAPRNEVEAYLADLWAELLEVKQVGINDNFFSLGGHSLLATQVMSRVRERYHVEIPLRSLFEMPTVANLAYAIAQNLASEVIDEDLEALLAEIEDSPEAEQDGSDGIQPDVSKE